MLGMILLCALAAAGLLTVLWAIFGLLSAPFGRYGAAVVLRVGSAEQLEHELRAWSWLQKTGLTAAPLLIVPTEEMQHIARSRCRTLPGVRLCSSETVTEYIEMELKTCSSRN